MRTPFGWTLRSRTSLRLVRVVCACCAICGAPAVALSAPGQVIASGAVAATSAAAVAPSAANNGVARADSSSFDRRVLILFAMGCVIGLIAGWVGGAPRDAHVRLFNKPKKKVRLSVLVPPGPAPRLVPGDSPNATRARSTRPPVPRQTPAGATGSGAVDYIAAFGDPADTADRVDYLLASSDGEGE